jgi:anti-sigma B factor antagonist
LHDAAPLAMSPHLRTEGTLDSRSQGEHAGSVPQAAADPTSNRFTLEPPLRNGMVGKHTVEDLTLVTLAGELDVATVAGLRRALNASSDATVPDLAIDLRQVTFMDCAVLGVFIDAYNRVAAAGGCLRIIGPPTGPLRLVQLCGLDDVLCVHDSVEVATAAVCVRHDRERRPQANTLADLP